MNTAPDARLAIANVIESLAREHRERAVDALAADGPIARTMAAWSFETALAAHDADALAAITRDARHANETVAVLLADTVPTAPLRALLLPFLWGARALHVRPPRRAPRFTTLVVEVLRAAHFDITLHDLSGPALVARLDGDGVQRLIAFGRDESLATIAATIAPGILLEAHGHGFGIAVMSSSAFEAHADDLARDIAAFEQRGCLSPQCIFVAAADARPQAAALHRALTALASQWPAPPPAPDEAFALRSWLGAIGAASVAVHRNATHAVAALETTRLASSPGQRHIAVVPFTDATALETVLASHEQHLTVIAHDESAPTLAIAPHARRVAPGQMQSPPLDGWEDPRPPKLTRR